MNHLTDYLVCNIDIEKSTTALHLEKEYGIEWGFNQQTPLDSHFHLKACITKPVKINPHSVMPMPTGIYPQLKNPNFELEVHSSSSVLYDQGIALAEGVTYFTHTFRNEIWLLIENKFDTVQTIQPTQNLALLTVKLRPQIVINYVHEIEKSDINIGSSKNYIQKIKKKINPEMYDEKVKRRMNKNNDQASYTRENIEAYKQGTKTLRKPQFNGAQKLEIHKGGSKK